MLSMFNIIKRTSSILLLFSLIFLIGRNNLMAQSDPESQAKYYFGEEQFQEALPIFKDLIHLYPTDARLNYYFGACLIETATYSKEAKDALEIAMEKEVKSLYYLGKYYHTQSDWENAISYYNEYINSAKKKELRTTNVYELLSLCEETVNPFIFLEEEIEAETEPAIELPTPISNNLFTEPNESLEIPEALKNTTINFPINASISYLSIDQFKTENGQQAFILGWVFDQELNGKLTETAELRETYGTASPTEKEQLAGDILKLEQETYQLNRNIRSKYSEANEFENVYWGKASTSERNNFKQKIAQMHDSIEAATKTPIEVPATLPINISQKSAKETTEEIPQQESTVDNISYKIQIGAYSKSPPDWVQNLFKKISVIRRIDQYTDDRGITVYTIGELKSYKDALQMQNQIRQEGVSDAFVAAYKNNVRINVNEARKLTEE